MVVLHDLIFGIVIIVWSIYAEKEIFNAVNKDQSEGLIKETGKVLWGVKDKITGIFFSLTELGIVYKAQKDLKKEYHQKKNQLMKLMVMITI